MAETVTNVIYKYVSILNSVCVCSIYQYGAYKGNISHFLVTNHGQNVVATHHNNGFKRKGELLHNCINLILDYNVNFIYRIAQNFDGAKV